MKARITYKGPLALYLSYFVLLVLSGILVTMSFAVERESELFFRLLTVGTGAAVISLALILYSTQIKREIHPRKWMMQADSHYNDEGIFEYAHDGFTVILKGGKSLRLRWEDITRAESGESYLNEHIKKFHIDLYITGSDFITVDSTMPGFHLFEKRLKGNLRGLLHKATTPVQETEAPDLKAGIS